MSTYRDLDNQEQYFAARQLYNMIADEFAEEITEELMQTAMRELNIAVLPLGDMFVFSPGGVLNVKQFINKK